MSGSVGRLVAGEMCVEPIASYERAVDAASRNAPYAFSVPARKQWISYETTDSFGEKLREFRKRDLAGIYVVDAASDDSGGSCGGRQYPLLRAISDALEPDWQLDDSGSDN